MKLHIAHEADYHSIEIRFIRLQLPNVSNTEIEDLEDKII
jgi:hypothetical protein